MRDAMTPETLASLKRDHSPPHCAATTCRVCAVLAELDRVAEERDEYAADAAAMAQPCRECVDLRAENATLLAERDAFEAMGTIASRACDAATTRADVAEQRLALAERTVELDAANARMDITSRAADTLIRLHEETARADALLMAASVRSEGVCAAVATVLDAWRRGEEPSWQPVVDFERAGYREAVARADALAVEVERLTKGRDEGWRRLGLVTPAFLRVTDERDAAIASRDAALAVLSEVVEAGGKFVAAWDHPDHGVGNSSSTRAAAYRVEDATAALLRRLRNLTASTPAENGRAIIAAARQGGERASRLVCIAALREQAARWRAPEFAGTIGSEMVGAYLRAANDLDEHMMPLDPPDALDLERAKTKAVAERLRLTVEAIAAAEERGRQEERGRATR